MVPRAALPVGAASTLRSRQVARALGKFLWRRSNVPGRQPMMTGAHDGRAGPFGAENILRELELS
jgi:hypothetical protein